MILTNKDFFEYIFFCGDIHGNYDTIPNFLKKHEIKNAAIIQLGDFGIGWENKHKEEKKLEYFAKRLAITNSKVFALRGNHDDPSWFKEYYSNGYVNLLPDYTILNLNNLNILCIGGATSIDRTNRKPYTTGKGIGWWKDEITIYNSIVKKLKDINIVATHTAPEFVAPFNKSNLEYWYKRDDKLNEDIINERKLMTKIYDDLKLNNNIHYWYYGHFHFTNKENYLGTTFNLLNINELVEHVTVEQQISYMLKKEKE